MDVNDLFTEQGLRQITNAWRDQHMQAASEYDQIAAIMARRLQQERIEGDRTQIAARRRAQKVSRQVKAMARHARRQAARAEALYGAYVNEVVKLPERREVAAARKDVRRAQRRQAIGAAVASSLHKSASALGGQEAVSPQVTGRTQAEAGFVETEPFGFPVAAGGEDQGFGSIHDYFPETQRSAR